MRYLFSILATLCVLGAHFAPVPAIPNSLHIASVVWALLAIAWKPKEGVGIE
jgi:hypothetical protein